jgi:hypothetical protein
MNVNNRASKVDGAIFVLELAHLLLADKCRVATSLSSFEFLPCVEGRDIASISSGGGGEGCKVGNKQQQNSSVLLFLFFSYFSKLHYFHYINNNLTNQNFAVMIKFYFLE